MTQSLLHPRLQQSVWRTSPSCHQHPWLGSPSDNNLPTGSGLSNNSINCFHEIIGVGEVFHLVFYDDAADKEELAPNDQPAFVNGGWTASQPRSAAKSGNLGTWEVCGLSYHLQQSLSILSRQVKVCMNTQSCWLGDILLLFFSNKPSILV